MDPIEAAVAEARNRLDAGDPVGAARAVERFEKARAGHEGLAMVWARLLPAVGNPKVLERQMRALAAEWPRHPVIALTIAEAGTRWSDPWPLTPGPDRLAALAVDILERCIADGRLPERWVAPLNLARARALARTGPSAEDEALRAFEIGLQAAPDEAAGWADLARLHQIRRRWAKGLAAAEHALTCDPDHQPARWTAAVCATALAHPSAASHWRALDHLPAGLDPDGRPQVADLPAIEVLLDPRTPPPDAGSQSTADTPSPVDAPPTAEVVWVHPISPAHGRIASPTALTLPGDFDDLVIWDPVPRGFRVVDHGGEQHEVPCFTALAVLGFGRARTWPVTGSTIGSEAAWPAGWRLYPFAERVRGLSEVRGDDGAAARGKLITPRAVTEAEVRAALAERGLTLSPPG